MSDGGIPVELQSWISLLEGLRAIQYSAFASFTFIVWDVCITLDQEVKYIWSQPATSPLKWLFLFNRYFAVVIQLIFLLDYNGVLLVLGGSTHVCRLWFTLQSLAIQALTSAAEVMLGIRVYALYNRSRTMGIVLAALFGAELLSVVPIYATEIPRMPFSILCSPLPSQPTVSFFAYVVSVALVVQTILLLLTLKPTIAAIRAGWGRTPIIVTLLRDGSWSFILQFAMVLINTTFNTVFGTFRGCEASVWQITMLSFSSCRLALNLFGLNVPCPEGDTDRLSTNIELPVDMYELDSRRAGAEGYVGNPASSSASLTLVGPASPDRPSRRDSWGLVTVAE